MYSLFHSRKVTCDDGMSLKETRSGGNSTPFLPPERRGSPVALAKAPTVALTTGPLHRSGSWNLVERTEETGTVLFSLTSVAELVQRSLSDSRRRIQGPVSQPGGRSWISLKERMVYNPAEAECQTTIRFAPPDTIHQTHEIKSNHQLRRAQCHGIGHCVADHRQRIHDDRDRV